MFARGLVPLSIASVVLVIGAFALVFFYAPNDADQGFIQKIFYLHVPLAIVALCGFVAGGVWGLRYLRDGDRAHDLRSYVAIHLSLILGIGALGVQTRTRELIVPILALPLMIPVAIAAARATAPLLAEAGAGALPGRWLLILGLYDLVFGLLAFAVFDFLLEE